MEEVPSGFKSWAVLEIMGRKVVAGYVEEVTIAGAGLFQVTIPAKEAGDSPKTQYYHPSALYCLTPCTEQVARAVAARNTSQPEWAWGLPKAESQATLLITGSFAHNAHRESIGAETDMLSEDDLPFDHEPLYGHEED